MTTLAHLPRILAVLAALLLWSGCDGSSSSPGEEDAGSKPIDQTDTAGSTDVGGTPPQVCQPGVAFCNGATLYTCPDGSGYDKIECVGGCKDKICVNTLCAAGTKECQGTKTLRTCKADGSAWDVETCPEVCEAGACVVKGAACTPGEVHCDGAELKTCNAAGDAFLVTPCPYGCEGTACIDAACLAGAKRCNPEAGKEKEAQACAADQSGWTLVAACKDECTDGECVTLACEPGDTFCDGGTIKACNVDGSASFPRESCSFGCVETSGGPKCKQCAEGDARCKDWGTIEACADPVAGYQTVATCEDTQMCVVGQCPDIVAWYAEDTDYEAMLWFAIFSATCWLDGKANPVDQPCWVLDTTDLVVEFSKGDLTSWFCDGKADESVTAADFFATDGYSAPQIFDAADDIFGCGFWDGANFDVKVAGGKVLAGQPIGGYCIVYDTAFTDEIFVIECDEVTK